LVEVSGTIKVDLVDGVMVVSFYVFDTVALRAEDVSVESKAMAWLSNLLTDYSSESVGGDFLVGVVVLQDVSDCSERLYVLILIWIFMMKWIWIFGVTVGHGEVEGDVQVDLAAAEDVFEEVDVPNSLEFQHIDFLLFIGHHGWLVFKIL